MVVELEHFYGVYLLCCVNPKYKGRTYVGFTVNPVRRINQHNAGKHKGGAWKTSGRGPWDMTLIIHGFPSDISALRFEWAWQNPQRSRRLKTLQAKTRKETAYQYKLRILAHMLNEKPWSRLPLTIRWLMPKYQADLSPAPPDHMPIAFGPVKTIPHKKSTEKKEAEQNLSCYLCNKVDTRLRILNCPSETCHYKSHITCLAKNFLAQADDTFNIIPIEGLCPGCRQLLLWGELIFPTGDQEVT